MRSTTAKPRAQRARARGTELALIASVKHDDQVYRWMTPCPRTVGRDATIARAHAEMHELGIRHLPVLDEGHLVGVLSESDLAFAERFVDAGRVLVGEIMTPDPYVVVPYAPLAEVAEVMASRRLGSAIVVDKGNVIGVFTTTDALRALAEGHRDRSPTSPPTT